MAKNNGKSTTLSIRSMSREQLEELANKSVFEGKLRIARDALIELVRIDRTRYLPDLLGCCNMLAEQMARNGQLTEAQSLVTYIKNLGGESAVTVDLTLFQPGANKSDSPVSSIINQIKSGYQISPEHKYQAADTAIARGELPTGLPDSFSSDCNAVKTALSFVCDSEFEKAAEMLKPVSFESPFSQWKLLVRGMIFYYTGDNEKAEKAFAKIVLSTVPAKLAKSFLVLLNQKKYLLNDDTDREEVLKKSCVFAGYSKFSDVLPRAQYLWMTERYRDSFSHVEKTLPGFPSVEFGVEGNLTSFYFNILHHLEREHQSRYVDVFYKIVKSYKEQCDLKHLLAHRAACLHCFQCDDISEEELIGLWELFLEMYKKLYGTTNSLEAELYLFLGLYLNREGPPDESFGMLFSNKKKKRQSPQAEECLLKAVDLSKSRDAYLSLLQFYRLGERKKDCRVIIEEAVKAFPFDKELLCEAGAMAINRNAIYKGVEYLERAFTLDTLDSKLRENLILSSTSAGRNAAKSRSGVNKMRLYLKKAESLCPVAVPGFNSEPRFFVMRKAALEFLMGDESMGYADLERACSMAGDRLSLIYFGSLIFKIYMVPHIYQEKLAIEVHDFMLSKPTVFHAKKFIEVLEYVQHFKEYTSLNVEINRIMTYAHEALKVNPFTTSDIRKFIEFALNSQSVKIAQSIAKLALAADSGNLIYQFYSCKVKRDVRGYYPKSKLEKDRKKLRSILNEAQRLNDKEVIDLVSKELEQIDLSERELFDFPFDPQLLNDIADMDLPFPFPDDFFGGEQDFIDHPKKKRKRRDIW